ncbi:hypothetical protein V8D89_005046 [Ganoderma adspersum]
MGPDPTHLVFHSKAHRVEIRDLPADVLILIFCCLHGQEIARCMRVCRCFADLVHSDMYLQYKIELAQNGVVDGDSGASISVRLERLRKYSSNFRHGVFDYEDLTSHPEYVLRMVDLTLNMASPISSQGSSSALYYGKHDFESKRREYFFSVFIPGSALAGIPSSRCILPFEALYERARLIIKYAIDASQDLLVTVEVAEHTVPRLTEVYFYSLSGLKAARKTHPAAALPSLQVLQGGNGWMTLVKMDQLLISGDHIIWGLGFPHSPPGVHSIAVCNWKTGRVTKRLDFGKRTVHFALLDDEHILLSDRRGPPSYIDIYNISPSTPCRPVCALELPSPIPGERVPSYHWRFHTSEHATTPGGHFRVDPSSSMVVLTLISVGTSAERNSISTSYLLIPCTTLSAQILRAAKLEHSRGPPDRGDPREPEPGRSPQSDASSAPGPAPVTVPWSDWGPHGCLRLRAQRAPPCGYIPAIPFGSQMPLVASEGPDFTRVSVCVFDVNPFTARHARQVLAACRDHGSEHGSESESPRTRTAIVEDVEAVLPGVVDPQCSMIPYVVYRFELPFGPSEEPYGHAVQSVEMNMTGFTVNLVGSVRFEETLQTWTV